VRSRRLPLIAGALLAAAWLAEAAAAAAPAPESQAEAEYSRNGADTASSVTTTRTCCRCSRRRTARAPIRMRRSAPASFNAKPATVPAAHMPGACAAGSRGRPCCASAPGRRRRPRSRTKLASVAMPTRSATPGMRACTSRTESPAPVATASMRPGTTSKRWIGRRWSASTATSGSTPSTQSPSTTRWKAT
jgi:hypothetical protein